MEEKLQKFSDARGATPFSWYPSACLVYPRGPAGMRAWDGAHAFYCVELMGGPSVMPLDTTSPTSCCSRLDAPPGASWISVGQLDLTFLLGHAHPTSWHRAGKQFPCGSRRPLLPPNQGNVCFLRKYKHEILCAGTQRGPHRPHCKFFLQ